VEIPCWHLDGEYSFGGYDVSVDRYYEKEFGILYYARYWYSGELGEIPHQHYINLISNNIDEFKSQIQLGEYTLTTFDIFMMIGIAVLIGILILQLKMK
jgi:hypothetical protein